MLKVKWFYLASHVLYLLKKPASQRLTLSLKTIIYSKIDQSGKELKLKSQKIHCLDKDSSNHCKCLDGINTVNAWMALIMNSVL